jgi:hypothetical protein
MIEDLINALNLFIEGPGATSEFFASTNDAYEFILNRVIYPNPRISAAEKANLARYADTLAEQAFTLYGDTPNGALWLWDNYGDNVTQITNDQGILDVFNAAALATNAKREFDQMNEKAFDEDELKKSLTGQNIPAWAYAAGAIGLVLLFRR